jgi:hypothetical protein
VSQGESVVAAQGADHFRPLAVEGRRRPLQQDRERGRGAEVFAEDFAAFQGLGPGDVDGGRVEPVLDPDPDRPENEQDDRRDREHPTGVPQQQRLIMPHRLSRGLHAPPAYPPSHGW